MEPVLRTRITRTLLIAATSAVLAPTVVAPAQAAPMSSSSLSSAGSLSSAPSADPDEQIDAEEEIVVDIPGYGPYTISPDIQGIVTGEGQAGEDLLSAAVFSADYEGDATARDAATAALTPERRAEVTAGLAALHSAVAPPESVGPETPIVVLGNGLGPNGEVRPNLENRLQAALQLSRERPDAPVVVSGGPVGNGHNEAHAMRDWLLEHGVAEDRILVEDRSYSTVSNALHSRAVLPEAGSVIVVTSADHVHRAVVDFTLAFGPDAAVAGLGAPNDPAAPLPQTLRGAYTDIVNLYLG